MMKRIEIIRAGKLAHKANKWNKAKVVVVEVKRARAKKN
jgi:hypothetical protein